MKLSTNLVKQFAKITNQSKEKTNKKETIVYGKIKEQGDDGKWYVQLDGAAEGMLTPISSFTSSVDLDQRVIVMIKNHSAIVTGNIGSPATSQEYVDSKIYPTIGRDVNVTMGAASVQNYYSIEINAEGKPIYKVVDNTSVEGTKETIYEIPLDESSSCKPVDLADIRALWPDYNYE